ncbi:MAG: polysaccharide pyruvyl transferase family protein, partial [Acidimicrobiia bacterium]
SILAERLRSASSPAEASRAVVGFARRKLRPPRPAPPPSGRADPESPPVVRYVGWAGHDNLGDEALLEAVTRLLPWGEVRTKGPGDLLLLGGGTLVNRANYLEWLRLQDSPRIERAVYGTGVANPAYWGLNEPAAEWVEFLSTCCYVGVRGPTSAETLRSWGYRGRLEVVGDPALALILGEPVDRLPDRVALSPCWAAGELWGGSDQAVFDALAVLVKQLRADGREVVMLSCFPADDRPIFEMMRAAGEPDLPYLAGYAAPEEALRLLASSRLVVGERLHACVLAAAVGTPFVGIEYRPKVADFARSVDQESFVVRSDELSGPALPDRLRELEARWDEAAGLIAIRVDEYRGRLRAASEEIREVLG